jgi:CRISP-associated protein Cas1
MAWRGVHITKPGRLSLKDGQIVVAQEEGEVRLPLEDIGWIILDEPRLTLTSTLLAACAEQGIALIHTDARHMPISTTLPFHTHHRQAGIAALQLGLSLPFKKRCWQAIVRAKITNQAAVLAQTGRNQSEALHAMAKLVSSGDSENVEARAARHYWSALFHDFIRDDPADLRNKMLNYGYAVMRAMLARALVGAGLIPSLGLHHASQTNAYNLADDMIEPFRPLVDALVFERCATRTPTDEMNVDDRRALAGLPLQSVQMGKSLLGVMAATESCIASLVQAMEMESAALLTLPILKPSPPISENPP